MARWGQGKIVADVKFSRAPTLHLFTSTVHPVGETPNILMIRNYYLSFIVAYLPTP